MELANGEVIMHRVDVPYDPRKAHEYYLRTRHLKGRKKGAAQPPHGQGGHPHPNQGARARQKKELQARVQGLEKKLQLLEQLIKKKEHEAKAHAQKSKVEKARAAKKAAKPPSRAEKAKAARDAKQYRNKHKSELATKAKKARASGGSSKGSGSHPSAKGASVKELKMLATRVRGQLATAKAKLSAL